MSNPERVGILASGDLASGGGGSTADIVARQALAGRVAFDIGVVICNNPAGSVGVHKRFDAINADFGLTGDKRIDVVTIGPSTHPGNPVERGQTLDESAAVCRLLEERGIDFVAMLGFMRIITGEFVDSWGWKPEYGQTGDYTYRNGIYHPNARISNNHPAILPHTADTHGHGAHQRAVDLFRSLEIDRTAMTWHLASASVDDGPIIDEEPVKMEAGIDADKLSDRVQAIEKDRTAFVIQKHLDLRRQHLSASSS